MGFSGRCSAQPTLCVFTVRDLSVNRAVVVVKKCRPVIVCGTLMWCVSVTGPLALCDLVLVKVLKLCLIRVVRCLS